MESTATQARGAAHLIPLPPPAPGSRWHHALQLYRNPLPLFREWYQTVGPIYRFGVFGREYIVLAGLEANLLLKERDGIDFRSYEVFKEAGEQLHQSGSFISELDGEQHRQVRQTMQPGFTPEAVARYVPGRVDAAERAVGSWRVGHRLPMNATCRNW